MNTPMRLLIVDDEPQLLELLCDFFEPLGCDIRKASTGTEAIELIERERFDVILTDLKMPGPDGLEILRTARKIQSDAEVVLMTGYATVDTAIEAMRAGAFHYLMKPFKGQEVVNLVEKAYAQRQLRRENQFLKAEFRGEHQIQAMVGTSAPMLEMIAATTRLADTDTPTLLTGERGTGRTLAARVLHAQSSRSGGLFVAVYCAGKQEEMLEDELFGHAAGAWQQAVLPSSGKLELANHGTFYLADLGEAPPRIQERVLEFLSTRTVRPIGADHGVELDVRLVASCSRTGTRPPEAALIPGLREAFAPATIALPALRDRIEDIPLLLHHFLFEANRERKKPLQGFSQAALTALCGYTWPGNVRELRDLVRQISAKKKQGTLVDATDLPTDIIYGRRRKQAVDASPAVSSPDLLQRAIENIEKPMVLQALALAAGDRREAAAILNIDLPSFEELARRHKIDG
jgi:two-component system response regulator PilR (NtrC family)